MAFTFFTLGGRQLWEDVYFYQKWRIQRNCLTKRYRLLDNWDIRRESGSFDKCLKTLKKYIDIFQIPLPKKKAILFLHGLGGNKNQFKKMAAALETAGRAVIAINYPSTRKDFNAHLRQLLLLTTNLEGTEELSFVTYGMGGLLIRALLNSPAISSGRFKIGRIVQIDPPNRGNQLLETVSDFKILSFILGPLTKLGSLRRASKVPPFPEKTEFGIITTQNPLISFLRNILPMSWQRKIYRPGDSFLAGNRGMTEIKTWHPNPLADKKTIRACQNFLQRGSF